MNFLKTPSFLILIIFCIGCDSTNTEKNSTDNKKTDPPIKDTVDYSNTIDRSNLETESQHIEDIYLNVPSPMRTAIILNNAGAIYDHTLPLAPNIGHKYQTSDEQAVILGVYGTDLNYSVVSDEIMETELYLKSINLIGEKLGLDNILNEEVKTRVDNNIHRIDSMQVIISSLFWEVESALKENDRKDISALVVAGGWIEGLYISSQLSLQMPDNTNITNLISKQKYSIESLLTLLNANDFSGQITEKIVIPLNELKLIFDDIKESINTTHDKTDNNAHQISNNIELIYDQKTIDEIRSSITQIRDDITH